MINRLKSHRICVRSNASTTRFCIVLLGAHTCTFVLDLPEYSSMDIMYDRLNYAITYCSSIDGDGNMNEAPVSTNSESGWNTN